MEIQRPIARMAEENATWGEERIAAELLLKIGAKLETYSIFIGS
jgi:hypothetical protein